MNKSDHVIVQSAINILAAKTESNPSQIIDELTGFLWDEEEAGTLKKDWVNDPDGLHPYALVMTLHEEAKDGAH